MVVLKVLTLAGAQGGGGYMHRQEHGEFWKKIYRDCFEANPSTGTCWNFGITVGPFELPPRRGWKNGYPRITESSFHDLRCILFNVLKQ